MGSTATASARFSLATEMRSMGSGLSMISDLPTVTASLSDPGRAGLLRAPERAASAARRAAWVNSEPQAAIASDVRNIP